MQRGAEIMEGAEMRGAEMRKGPEVWRGAEMRRVLR